MDIADSGGVVEVTEGIEFKTGLEGFARGEGGQDGEDHYNWMVLCLAVMAAQVRVVEVAAGGREKKALAFLPIPWQLQLAALLLCPFGRL
jgi:hypothetical protein